MNITKSSMASRPRLQPVKLSETSGEPRDPQPTPDGKNVVFSSGTSQPLRRELYSASLDGSGQHQLTDRVVNLSWQPAISPDGKKIAYVVEKEGKSDLQVMNLDGTNNRNLTDTNKGYWNPFWSPDGSQIVTTSRDTENGNLELVSVASDGSGMTQLTDLGNDTESPVFSPTGSHIVFGLAPGFGALVLCSIKADGSEFKTYATDLNLVGKPAVSATGDIVFSASRGDGRFGIYGTKIDSEEPAKKLVDGKYAFSPTFSPDGQRIAFIEADESFNFQIHEAKADGTEVRQLTAENTDNSDPIYTPDGKNLLFVSNKSGKREIFKQEL